MVYDPSLGYDPQDPTNSASGRSLLARQGVNTLGNSTTASTSAQTAAANAVANEYARQYDLQYQLSKTKLDNDYQVALRNARTAQERNDIDRQYNQAQIDLAKQRLAQDQTQFTIAQTGLMPDGSATLSLQQLQAQNAATAGQLTGVYQGAPTLANLAQSANFLGTYNGQQTLAAQNQEQQYGLGLGALTGVSPNGSPTLAARGQEQNYGLNLAGVTGYGPNGAPTLSREQAAANTSLQAGQLASSLQGPGNWAKFLQAQYGIAGSPASSLVASVPGGLGAPAAANPPPMTLGSVLNAYGVAPQAGAGPSGQNGQQVYAGGSPSFNEAAGAPQWTPQMAAQAQQSPQWATMTPEQQQQVTQRGYYDPAPFTGTQPAYSTSGSSPWYVSGGAAPGGQSMNSGASGRGNDAAAGADVLSGGASSYAEGGGAGQQPAFLQGYAPYNLMGSIGQVANAPRVSNADLGFTDNEANTVQSYFNNPGSAPGTWWASKSQPERDYLNGVNSYWGGDPATFASRERNSRPTQGYASMA